MPDKNNHFSSTVKEYVDKIYTMIEDTIWLSLNREKELFEMYYPGETSTGRKTEFTMRKTGKMFGLYRTNDYVAGIIDIWNGSKVHIPYMYTAKPDNHVSIQRWNKYDHESGISKCHLQCLINNVNTKLLEHFGKLLIQPARGTTFNDVWNTVVSYVSDPRAWAVTCAKLEVTKNEERTCITISEQCRNIDKHIDVMTISVIDRDLLMTIPAVEVANTYGSEYYKQILQLGGILSRILCDCKDEGIVKKPDEEVEMKTTITKEFMQKEFRKLCGIIQNEIQPILNNVDQSGGFWNIASHAGLMSWYVNDAASGRYRIIGARLLNDDTLAVWSGEKYNYIIKIKFSTDYTHGFYIRMDDLKRHQMHEPITANFFETLYVKCMNAFEDDLWEEIGYPDDIKAKKKMKISFDIDEILAKAAFKFQQETSKVCADTPNATVDLFPSEIVKMVKALCDVDAECNAQMQEVLPAAPSFENVDRLVFNGPATIVYWKDGTMTVVKATKGETIDPEKGFAMAALKKVNGNTANYMRKLSKLFKKAEIIEPKRKKKTKKTNTDIVATANVPKKTTKKKVDPNG